MTTEFIFASVSDDGTRVEYSFTSEAWYETFPKYLAFLRGTGYTIGDKTQLAPDGLASFIIDENDYLVDVEPEKHSKCYYDSQRNK